MKRERNRRKTRAILGFAVLLALLLALLALNLRTGSVEVEDVARILLRRGGTDTAGQIVWNIRFPRLLAAGILGGALSLSGFLLQTFFGNPIAGPFVLGISSGAKLTVALTMIVCLSRGIVVSSMGLILAAFAGSMFSMGLILAVSGKVRQMSLLVVCGVMIGYICSAVTDFVVTFADDANIVNLHHWSLGSFSGISWGNVQVLSAVVCPCAGAAFLLSKPMGAYQLGETYARNMGVNLRRFRLELILLSSLLSACVTAFAGPVSFVGIAVPHLMRSLFQTARPLVLLPACFLGGAVFCLFCDWIARTAFAPTELSISSVTAVFGAPVVVVMMLSRQRSRVREKA